MDQFGGRTNEILARLADVDRKATQAADSAQASSSTAPAPRAQTPTLEASRDFSAVPAQDAAPTPSSRFPLPPLPDFLDAALDKHPADLSHLLDPQGAGGETPLPFVSKRGLEQAVAALTENFRSWLDAIYQSIIAALQNKADSAQVEDIARHVQDAAARASDSVAKFATRSLGGRCASCDAPVSDDSMHWKRPAPSTSGGRWMPKINGAQNSIRPPTAVASAVVDSRNISSTKGPALPACGTSKLPTLQDFRVSRDFPKGKVLKNAASDSALRVLRHSDLM